MAMRPALVRLRRGSRSMVVASHSHASRVRRVQATANKPLEQQGLKSSPPPVFPPPLFIFTLETCIRWKLVANPTQTPVRKGKALGKKGSKYLPLKPYKPLTDSHQEEEALAPKLPQWIDMDPLYPCCLLRQYQCKTNRSRQWFLERSA